MLRCKRAELQNRVFSYYSLILYLVYKLWLHFEMFSFISDAGDMCVKIVQTVLNF